MARRGPGRPSKLDADRKERIISALKAGNYRQVACEFAGIGYGTFSKWMHAGARRTESEYGSFRAAVLEAERQAEVRCVARVMAATENDWKAAAWWLERKRSERWSRKDRLEHVGAKGGPIQAKVLHGLTDDTLDQVESLLRQASEAPAQGGATAAAPPQAREDSEPDGDS